MLQPTIMEPHVRWSEVVSQLKPEDEDLLFGTSLSRRFSRLPLWLSHPANIGMFYGFLISLALIFPYMLRYDSSTNRSRIGCCFRLCSWLHVSRLDLHP